MSNDTISPTPTPNPSSIFANEPLLGLLKRPTHLMSPEELRATVQELRQLRTSPQALGKKLRQEVAKKVRVADEKEETATPRKGSLDDLMKELEG